MCLAYCKEPGNIKRLENNEAEPVSSIFRLDYAILIEMFTLHSHNHCSD